MHALTIEHVPLARRKVVNIWYPAFVLSLSDETLARAGLDLEPGRDDLGHLGRAYLEVQGVPVMLMRRDSEPVHTYTLMIDAANDSQWLKLGALTFAASVVENLRFSAETIQWVNKDLDQLFPAHQDGRTVKR